MEKLLEEVLTKEGVATIVTQGLQGPHVVATWNSYIGQDPEGALLIPAGGMKKTEANVHSGSKLTMLIGSKEIAEKMENSGAGFRLTGNAGFQSEGELFERTKERFPWARSVLVFQPEKVERLI